MEITKGKRASIADVLRNRNFLVLLITVSRLTGSTVAVGVMMVSLTLPQLLFSILSS